MNISVVQRAYCTKYKNEKAPSRSVILNIVFVFEKKTGSVAPMPPKRKKKSKKI